MGNFIREKAEDSNEITRAYFNEILVEMRHIDAVKPNTELELYGKTFATPVMTAALSHLKGKNSEGDGMIEMAEGARIAGAVNWAGMGSNEQYKSIAGTYSETIRIIKPYDDEGLVYEMISQAEQLNSLAVGMDLDHSFNSKGNYDNVLGFPMRPRSLKEIGNYCRFTKLPFIIKGVISRTDALKCLEAGVSGIVVSHHHGIMPSAVPPLMVLPEISEAIGGRIPIFVDCGIMNGSDVFKALALGASAVSIGRPVMNAILADGAEGAAAVINTVTEELAGMMARTCSKDIKSIDPALLRMKNGSRPIQ